MHEEKTATRFFSPIVIAVGACFPALLLVIFGLNSSPPASSEKTSILSSAILSNEKGFIDAGLREISENKLVSTLTVEKLRGAALGGDVESQLLLGARFAIGEGVIKDEEEAIRWFKMASTSILTSLVRRADKGEIDAMLELDRRFFNGIAVPPDKVIACGWLRKAAMKGDAQSQFNLGARLTVGEGGPVDAVEAYAWYNLAAAAGYSTGNVNAGAERDRVGLSRPDLPSLGQKRSRELLRQIEEAKAAK